MEPSAEQLIRDYLNRLSVAARTRLGSDDRRAFLARTRRFIESRSRDPDGVHQALSGLGEPAVAVENEYARLAAERSKRAAASGRSGLWRPRGRAVAEPRGSAPAPDRGPDADAGSDLGPDPAPAPGSRAAPGGRRAFAPRRLPRAAVDVSHLADRELKGDIEKKVKVNRPLTSRWRPGTPARQPQRVPRPRVGGPRPRDVRSVSASGSSTGSARADSSAPGTQPADSRPAGTGAPSPQVSGLDSAGPPSGAHGPAPAGHASPTLTPPGTGSPEAAGPGAHPPQPVPGAAGSPARPANGVPAPVTSSSRLVTSRQRLRRARLPGLTQGLGAGLLRYLRQHRLESAAVVLMLLSGLVYPFPIWVLGFSLWLFGALLAAASKQWSPWEKWAGLLGPVVLVIAGTSIGLALGGQRHTLSAYVHEVLADSRYMIQIAALVGAGYLAWRAHRGRRFRMPPWNRPHRI
jgi:hypothetical protein